MEPSKPYSGKLVLRMPSRPARNGSNSRR
ncbi:hypothetical protein NXX42_24865 [Bacteroides thetaiotaomicron]|nr:hypothetical protein [Bacteroides thetaiotaomicron]